MLEVRISNYFVQIEDINKNGIIPRGSFIRAQCGWDPKECLMNGTATVEEIPHEGLGTLICYRCSRKGRTPVFNQISGSPDHSIYPNDKTVYCGMLRDWIKESGSSADAGENNISVTPDK